MKKKANISLVMLTCLICISAGAVILNIAINSKTRTKIEYERIENRYIAESGIDLATGLFISYLENRDITASYECDGAGDCYVIDDLCPYLIDEIRENPYSDDVHIDIIEKEARDYLVSVGFKDFGKADSLQVFVTTNGMGEGFKINNLCTEPDFLLSDGTELGEKKSLLKPIYLTVKSKYPNGNVIANIKVSNIYAVREAFSALPEGEMGNVRIWINTENAEIEFVNYQNYGGRD